RLPFIAKTEEELKYQVLNREVKPLRQIKDSISPEVERICLKALSKQVSDRYTNAKDLADELSRGLKARVECPSCHITIDVRDNRDGRVACPNCGTWVRVPLPRNRHPGFAQPMSLQEIEQRIDSADDAELQRILRFVPQLEEAGGVGILFRFLAHPSRPVRAQARRSLHEIGWD